MQYARTLWELMERRVEATPDALMAVDEDMQTLTFAEFWSEAERAAAGLAAAGVAAGDVVTWQLPTWIESLVLTAALSRLGVVQNPMSPACGERELDLVTAQAGSSLLVTPSTWQGLDLEQPATAIARRHGGMRVLVADRALPQGDPTSLPLMPPALVADDQPVRWLFATDGVAPVPRVAQHTDASLLAAARALSQRLALIPQDRFALVLPVSHIDGIVWLLAGLESGCANILCETADAERMIEVLGREGVTLAGAGMSFHRAYLEQQRRRLEPIFPDVRLFTGCDGPTSPELVAEVRSAFDVPVLAGYGPTEAPVVAMAAVTDAADVSAHSAGAPVPGVEVRVVGADGRLVDPGDEGEIRLRGPQVMRGYLDAVLDAEAFDADGFLRTGDTGRLDERGNLVVTGDLVELDVFDLPEPEPEPEPERDEFAG